MDWNIFDVFGIPVQEIPENAILQWDWCKRVLVELPAETLTCDDIIDCVQWELDNIWAALNGKIGCTQVASCPVIIGLQDQINALPNSILDNVKFYVNSLNDSTTTEVANWGTMTIYWLDWLRFLTNPISGVHEFRLPSGANDRDVLVWRDSAGWAVWETISDCLCNQIATCPSITALENMYTALQNQINYLLWLDPSDQPVLTCSDVARCIWAGTTDVDHAMAQWITNWIEWDNLLASITAIENEVSGIEIRTCANVMACAGISAMWTEISNLWIRVSDNEWEISAIRGILSPLQSTVASLWASLSSAEWNIVDLQTNYTTILWLVNNHSGRIAAIESDILTLQWQWASNIIRTCSDVMACGWIIDLVNLAANLEWRVTVLESLRLSVMGWDTFVWWNIRTIRFDDTWFSVTLTAPWVITVENLWWIGSWDMEKAVYDVADISEQLVGITATQTLTNKRITPRVYSVATTDVLSLNTNNFDAISITNLAQNITIWASVTWTPYDFQKLMIRIKDNWTSRDITWWAEFAQMGVALPLTTIVWKVMSLWFLYDTVLWVRWLVASSLEI